MKVVPTLFVLAASLASCSDEANDALSESVAVRNLTDLAIDGMPDGTTVLAQCGSSEGHAAFETIEGDIEWGEDGMQNGMIVIVKYPDGEFDILSRDATDIFSKISDYGGIVEQVFEDETLGRKSFVAKLPDGAIQTFQYVPLRKASDHWSQAGRLFWSQTKPGGDILMPSTFAFIADCY